MIFLDYRAGSGPAVAADASVSGGGARHRAAAQPSQGRQPADPVLV